ncbi:MAG TPA: ATP-binding cassette domain-containing protein [Gaiellaceae bacterium]|nr:ATP-binding cassette domain-containing protein [Gaiellaceae bacterium]
MYEYRVHRTPDGIAIRAEGLGKRYGDLWALRDLDLEVPAGSVLGLLGHNGAGKTTAIRILTTLTAPTTGYATVAGLDVVADAKQVRSRIGLAGQNAAVDDLLTARANLEMIGRLYHLPRTAARARASELLERFDLAGDVDRLVREFSGGMRRRLDLAAALVASPPVLFLDEPTTGLDPRSRNELWALLSELVDDGATLVLTTQYLEEADHLADEIIVLDHGRIAAEGTPAGLKERVARERVTLTVPSADQLTAAERALAPFADGPETRDDDALTLTMPVVRGTRLVELVRTLDAAGVEVTDVSRSEPTLDDVFLVLTDPTRKAAA